MAMGGGYSKPVAVTDFPEPGIRFYCPGWVMYLPGEYSVCLPASIMEPPHLRVMACGRRGAGIAIVTP